MCNLYSIFKNLVIEMKLWVKIRTVRILGIEVAWAIARRICYFVLSRNSFFPILFSFVNLRTDVLAKIDKIKCPTIWSTPRKGFRTKFLRDFGHNFDSLIWAVFLVHKAKGIILFFYFWDTQKNKRYNR